MSCFIDASLIETDFIETFEYTSAKLRALKRSKERVISDNILKTVIKTASDPFEPNELLYKIDHYPIMHPYYDIKQFKLCMATFDKLASDIIKLLRLKLKDDISIFIVYKFNNTVLSSSHNINIDEMLNSRFYAIHSDEQKIENILEDYKFIKNTNGVDINICIKW